MTSKYSVLEMTLNMLVRSRNSAVCVGSMPAACLWVMYFSIARKGCVDDYAASVGDSNGKAVWEEVFGKLGFEFLRYVSWDYSSDCGWHSYGSEHGGVGGVFVEAE